MRWLTGWVVVCMIPNWFLSPTFHLTNLEDLQGSTDCPYETKIESNEKFWKIFHSYLCLTLLSPGIGFFFCVALRPFCAPWACLYIISSAGIVSGTPHPAV